MRRQTATGGINPAGSSRALRLDPLSLPQVSKRTTPAPTAACGEIEIRRDRVMLRRAVHGMRMAINVRVCEFLGVALRGIDGDAQMLVLAHRDPSLSVPLAVSADRDEIESACADVERDVRAAATAGRQARASRPQRRRRRNAIRDRRPKFLMRRRAGDTRPRTGHPSRRARDHRAELSRPTSITRQLRARIAGGSVEADFWPPSSS